MASVFDPAASVALVHGEGHTVLVGQTSLLTLVNVLVLGNETAEISSMEVNIVSNTTW